MLQADGVVFTPVVLFADQSDLLFEFLVANERAQNWKDAALYDVFDAQNYRSGIRPSRRL